MSNYDRAITVFSPDGHLLQVRYAAEAVSRGLCAAGVKGRDCIVLIAEKKLGSKLQDVSKIKKIEIVDHGVAVVFAGLAADGRILIDKAKIEAQNYYLSADEPASVEYIVKYTADLQQKYTIKNGVRPFGVATLFGGFNKFGEPCIYKTEPHGVLFQWKAHAIGRSEKTVNEFFDKYYKKDMELNETISFVLGALSQIIDCNQNNIEILTITRKDKNEPQINYLKPEEIKAFTPYKPETTERKISGM